MIRRRLVVALSTLFLLFVALLSIASVIAITQTSWGRSKVRVLGLAELRRLVHGRIYIGRVDGTLFTNVTIDSLEVRDPAGELVLATGRLHAEYDPRDLADRRVLLRRLEVEHPIVRLVHHHDDTWNIGQLFSHPAPRKITRRDSAVVDYGEPRTRGFGDFIVATNVVVHHGAFYYSNRWNPDDTLRGAKRDTVVAEALRRPHFGLARSREGLMRTLSWTDVNLASPYLRFADPDSAGLAFDLARLDVDEFFPPFRISHVSGRVTIANDTLRASLPHAELPGSVASGGGKVFWGPNRPPIYALHFTSESVALNDIAWVHPNLPHSGGGRAVVDIRSERANPDVVDFIVSNMDVQSTDSRLRGDVTFESGRPELVIKNVSLEAAPVDFALIRVLAGGKPFPVDWAGQWTGHVRGSGGMLSRWHVDSADLTLHDAHVPGATSRLGGSGEINISDPALLAFHHFQLALDHLDLRTPQFVLPEFPRLHGSVSGTATMDSVWNDVRFSNADITHTDGGAVADHVTGSGRFTLGDSASRYDMALEAGPLSFTTLAQSYPVIRLRGEFSGPVTMEGTLGGLDLTANLGGPPGAFKLDGHFDLTRPGLAGSGALILSHVDLQSMLDDDSLPQTDISGRFDADVHGDSMVALDGPISGTLARSSVGRVRLDTGRVVGRFGGARLRLDSLSIETRAGALTGSGGLSLTPRLRDSLGLAFATDSLGGLRKYLVDETADSAQTAPLVGAMQLSAGVTGWLDSLGVAGTVAGSAMRIDGVAVHSLAGTFDVRRVRSPALGTAELSLEGATVGNVAFDRIDLSARLLGTGSTTVAMTATMPTGPHAAALAEVRQSADTTAVTLDSLAVYTHDNAWHLTSPAHAQRDAAGISLDGVTVRGAVAGLVTAQASVPNHGAVSATVHADSVPLADLGELYQATAAYGGLAAWDLHVAGERANPTMELNAHLTDAQFGDVRLEEALARGQYANRRLSLHGDLVQRGDTTLHVLVSMPTDLALVSRVRRILDDSLRGNIHADSVGFGALATVYPALQNPQGAFAANVDIGGTLRHPTLNGDIRLSNAEAGFPRLGVRFIGMNADLHLAGDSLAVRELTVASLDGQTRGRATLHGWVTFADLTDPQFDLSLAASDLHALSNPRVADVVLSTEQGAALHLTGQLLSSQLTGAVVVDRGTILLPDILTQKKVVSLDDPQFYEMVDTSLFENRSLAPASPSRLLDHLAFRDVQVALGSDVWLRSSEASINLTTGTQPLSVTTAQRDRDSTRVPALAGTVIAARGTYRLNLGLVQRTFIVQTGTVRFTGSADNDADVDIRALYTVRQPPSSATGNVSPEIPIQVVLYGAMSDPKVRLTSEDTLLSPSDLLSYLITGQQSFNVAQANTNGPGAQVAQFVLPTLGTALSSRLSGGWLDYVDFETGAGSDPTAQQGGGFTTALTATRIAAGKQIGRSTFLSADLGVCTLAGSSSATTPGTASQIGLRVEQQLTRTLSLAASSEPGTRDLYCSEGALSRSFVTTPRQWGLDLYHSWQF